jgi:hypothetical protein
MVFGAVPFAAGTPSADSDEGERKKGPAETKNAPEGTRSAARSCEFTNYSCMTWQGTSLGVPQLRTASPRKPSNQTPGPA